MSDGPVALVGAGPGDPGLLSLRAEALLGLAAIVVADASVATLARSFAGAAELVTVPDGCPAAAALLRATGQAGGQVVRLYRGDPWLNPAFGAEQDALTRQGICSEAVAGVAVEVAVLAQAGVPVHVRRLAVACTLGPFDAMPPATDPARTLVASGDDPAAMVRAAVTTGDGRLPAALVLLADPQAAWQGSLEAAAVPAETMRGPALLVVGDVCRPRCQPASGGSRPGSDSGAAGGEGRR